MPLRVLPRLTMAGLLVLLVSPLLLAPALSGNLIPGTSRTYALTFSANSSSDCGVIPSTFLVPCLDKGWSVEGRGSISWTAVQVNQTTAVLNDTVQATLGHLVECLEVCYLADNVSLAPNSILESVSLTSRRISLSRPSDPQSLPGFPFTTFSPLGLNLSQVGQIIASSPLYTVWWVNTPLSIGDEVNVLVLTATVNGTQNVNLGGLGNRTAWTLSAGRSTVRSAIPCPVDGCSVNVNGFSFKSVFDYERSTGLLLTANFDLTSINDVQTYHYSTGGSSYVVTSGSTLTVHASLRLVSNYAWPGPIWINPSRPPSNNDNSPARTPADGSQPSTLLGEITAPKTLASASALVLAVGLAGLLMIRRSKRNTGSSPSIGEK